MELLSQIWEFVTRFFYIIMHIDQYLRMLVGSYGNWAYVILFVIVFCETGLVITPFLPGDSLLFAAGTLAGAGYLDYFSLVGILLAAAIIGDAVNFRIGHYIGPPIFTRNYRWLKREHLEKAHAFYEKHGGKAIILARFIPIIRTFAPFVAGVAQMHQGRFLLFNIVGALIWVIGLVSAGFFLGNFQIVQDNFSIVIYLIIFISVLPVIVEAVKHYLEKKRAAGATKE